MNDYYQNCPLSKPINKKKKKKCNGWKDKPNRYCYYTGQAYAQRHELFLAAHRQTSIDMGFQIDLHPAIHKLFHGEIDKNALKELHLQGMFPDPEAWANREIKKHRQLFQMEYETKLIESGVQRKMARELWKTLIGGSYLDD